MTFAPLTRLSAKHPMRFVSASEHFDRCRRFYGAIRQAASSGFEPMPKILQEDDANYFANVFLDAADTVYLADLTPDVMGWMLDELESRNSGRVPMASRLPFDRLLLSGFPVKVANSDELTTCGFLLERASLFAEYTFPGEARPLDKATVIVSRVPMTTERDFAGPDARSDIFGSTPDKIPYQPCERIGYFLAGSPHLGAITGTTDEESWRLSSVAMACVALALFNQPNIVTTAPGGTRGTRRRLEREAGLPAEQNRQVVWNLSREAVAAQDSETGRSGVALHVRRGHQRHARALLRRRHPRRQGLQGQPRPALSGQHATLRQPTPPPQGR